MSIFPTRVLLAVDGSEEAESAARTGIELASKTGSELHVIHVASYPSIQYVPEEEERMRGELTEREGYRLVYAAPFSGILQVPKQEYRRELGEREGRKVLDEQLEKIRRLGGDISLAHLSVGHADEEIVKLAEEIDAGIIVMCSRGLGSVRRALMGSVSGAVVRHAHCAILVVRR